MVHSLQGPLFADAWIKVSEQSAYWAERWDAVQAFRPLTCLPEWCKWKHDTLPDVLPGENRGKTEDSAKNNLF